MPARQLILEITERSLVDNEERTHRSLRQLERLGVGLAVDDYGVAYSSLATLRRLPIREVKIDRSFIEGIPTDSANDAIIKSTIQLAHTLGTTVVAEGVQTQGELDRLHRLGCDRAQGYLIGHPQPPQQLNSLLNNTPPSDPNTPVPQRARLWT